MVLSYREGITSDAFRYFHSNFSYILMSIISCYDLLMSSSFYIFIIFIFCSPFIPVSCSHTFHCCQFNAMSEQCRLTAQCTCEMKRVLLVMLFYVSWKFHVMTVTWKLYNYFSVPSCIIFLRPHLDISPIQRSLSRGWSRGHTLSSSILVQGGSLFHSEWDTIGLLFDSERENTYLSLYTLCQG